MREEGCSLRHRSIFARPLFFTLTLSLNKNMLQFLSCLSFVLPFFVRVSLKESQTEVISLLY